MVITIIIYIMMIIIIIIIIIIITAYLSKNLMGRGNKAAQTLKPQRSPPKQNSYNNDNRF